MDGERNYFMRRAAQEHAAAASARGKAREAHREMERRYGELVRVGDASGETVEAQ